MKLNTALNSVLLVLLSVAAVTGRDVLEGMRGILLQEVPKECLQRELLAFNNEFDSVAYRDMVLADAGLTAEQVKEAYKEAGNEGFDQTPEYVAAMAAIEKRRAELEQVNRIETACSAEVAGSQSAIGVGSMVASLLNQALEGPIDSELLVDARQEEQNAITLCGLHLEGGFIAGGVATFYTTGARKDCLALGVFGGAELSLAITTLGMPTNATFSCMVDIDFGFGPHIGYSSGAIVALEDSTTVSDFTIGAGFGGGFAINSCTFYWTS